MTLLVQIDKLVQLIESPVFTCEFVVTAYSTLVGPTSDRTHRPETPTSRAGEISVPLQVFVWPFDVVAAKFGFRLSEEQA